MQSARARPPAVATPRRPVTSTSEGKHSEHESQRSQPVRPVTARTWAKMADASPYLGGGAMSTHNNELYNRPSKGVQPKPGYQPLSARATVSAATPRQSALLQPQTTRRPEQAIPAWPLPRTNGIKSVSAATDGPDTANTLTASSGTRLGESGESAITIRAASAAHQRKSSFMAASAGTLSEARVETVAVAEKKAPTATILRSQSKTIRDNPMRSKEPGSTLEAALRNAIRSNNRQGLRNLLIQPGPFAAPLQCRVQRHRGGMFKPCTFSLLLELDGASLSGTPPTILTAIKRKGRGTAAKYIISMEAGDLSLHGPGLCGSLHTNNLGTDFTLLTEASSELGAVGFKRSSLGAKGPRKMSVALPLLDPKKDTPKARRPSLDGTQPLCTRLKDGNSKTEIHLINKPPKWNQMLQAYCLNFGGRVTQASVKNFQLITSENEDRTVLQFGRVGDDSFTMDFAYPMTLLQARFQIA
uniref:Tubby C-terminal domain-containing protein n=1 Tax=Auxenochlorella protothecoides TaxID=3075 RepID=A0A1D2A2C0_AUXPR